MILTKTQWKIVGLTAIGGTLEFYDFTIYALFAPYISQHFFANSSQLIGLINTFAVFALGYLARPLGGIIFGHIGDRYGRKYAFSLATLTMAIATLLMGCLPSYQTIGIFAPIILVGLRLIQGFSVGGEIPGAAVFTVEHIPAARHGLSMGLIFMCITLGNTLGAGIGLILTTGLTQENMTAWGWRIPFILGFFLGIVSFIIRNKTIETPEFISFLKEEKLHRVPLFVLLKTSRKTLLHCFLLTAITSAIISLFLYLPTYLANIIHIEMSYAYFINFISFLLFAFMTACFGWLSDHLNRKKILIIGAILFILLSYPLFCGLKIYGEGFVWVFTCCFALCGGMINGSYAVLIAESFPANLRYSGVGLSYSLGIALFGGVAPLFFTYLIGRGESQTPAYYLLFCATLTLIAILTHRKEAHFSSPVQITGSLHKI